MPTTTAEKSTESVLPNVHDAELGAARPNRTGRKLAAAIAGRIVADIAAAGWPEGRVIGSETELLERYNVSRSVLREAVRLLEHQRVGRMRRGPGGGLVVAAPSMASATDAVAIYLVHLKAPVRDVFELRITLEEAAAALASSRLTEAAIRDLRKVVEDESLGREPTHTGLHSLVGVLTRNPALAFFIELLTRVTQLYLPDPSVFTHTDAATSTEAHAKIVASIVSGDAGRARDRMRRHLEAEAQYLGRLPSRPRLGSVFADEQGGDKRGVSVARSLFEQVVELGWPVGQSLGSEADLMERFSISRSIVREAVRVLEHHQIARMRPGPGGGLFVAAPGFDATAEAVALHLDRCGIGAEHLMEVRTMIELAALDRVVGRIDDGLATRLNRVLQAEEDMTKADYAIVGHDFHTVLAECSGNRVFALFTDVLVHLARSHMSVRAGAADPLPNQDATRIHRLIVEAVSAGDLDVARLRMRKHLKALALWTRP